jgi:short-subunit dehydrogenase
MKKAMIIGASSGIGLALARALASRGWELGLAARRVDRLEALRDSLPGGARVCAMDVSRPAEAVAWFHGLVGEMGGADLVVLCAGVDFFNSDLKWEEVEETIAVNVAGFAALANAAYGVFEKQGRGHIAGVSSVACLRGSSAHPAYSASKAFVSNYMEALQIKARRECPGIVITDIRPGNVETPMSAGQTGRFWIATPEAAAEQICIAIQKKKRIAYITPRWAWIARLLRSLPFGLYAKI